MSSKTLTATATSGSFPYETKLVSRQHQIIGDEPEDIGGRDTGPRPSELLCMSLASCTAITLSMYAARKGWDTGIITVTVSRTVNETDTDFKTDIHFEKSLDEEIKERMMLVAKKCPVHKILTHPISMETNIV